jgi:hypothetical protein
MAAHGGLGVTSPFRCMEEPLQGPGSYRSRGVAEWSNLLDKPGLTPSHALCASHALPALPRLQPLLLLPTWPSTCMCLGSTRRTPLQRHSSAALVEGRMRMTPHQSAFLARMVRSGQRALLHGQCDGGMPAPRPPGGRPCPPACLPLHQQGGGGSLGADVPLLPLAARPAEDHSVRCGYAVRSQVRTSFESFD